MTRKIECNMWFVLDHSMSLRIKETMMKNDKSKVVPVTARVVRQLAAVPRSVVTARVVRQLAAIPKGVRKKVA